MYLPQRPSILQRPVRAEAKANVENREAEYEREQARIAAKAQRQASTEERLIRSFYGTEEEKRSGWENTQRELQQHAQARQATLSHEQQREEAWLAQPQQVYVDTQRPWTAQSTTYHISRQDEEEARRRAEREAAERNRLMAFAHTLGRQREREAEQAAIRSTMQSEDTWFNRGAASERWVPPELRVKHRTATPAHFAPAPPPYHCDAVPAAERPSTAPTSARRNTYWERDSGAGVKSALSHDYYMQAQEQGPPAGRGSQAPPPAPPAQRPAAEQKPRYPWCWDA